MEEHIVRRFTAQLSSPFSLPRSEVQMFPSSFYTRQTQSLPSGSTFYIRKRRQKDIVWCTLTLQRLNRGPALRIIQFAFINISKRWMLLGKQLLGLLIFWDGKLSLWVNVSKNETSEAMSQPYCFEIFITRNFLVLRHSYSAYSNNQCTNHQMLLAKCNKLQVSNSYLFRHRVAIIIDSSRTKENKSNYLL